MINEVILIGNVGADPVVRQTAAGTVGNFSLATSEKWKNKQGDWQEKTEWHRIVGFGYPGEYIERHIRKGQQVFVKGKITYGQYEKDGQTIYTTEIKAEKVKILGRRDQQEVGGKSSYDSHNSGDDLPF